MNIFYLDRDIQKCAEYHCDKHVVKMITEYNQQLTTCMWYYDYNRMDKDYFKNKYDHFYKPTHINHPCNIWLRKSHDHYDYLYQLTLLLSNEYTNRYNKKHKSGLYIENILPNKIKNLKYNGWIDPPQCIPDEYKVDGDVVQAYRNYYIGDKSKFATWKNNDIPTWYKKGLNNV